MRTKLLAIDISFTFLYCNSKGNIAEIRESKDKIPEMFLFYMPGLDMNFRELNEHVFMRTANFKIILLSLNES